MARVLSVIILGIILAVFGIAILANQRDAIWSEVHDPNYARTSNRLPLEQLYSRYQRDMSLMPQVTTLSTVLASRGQTAADFILRKLNERQSPDEVANAVFVFREMRRIKTFDLCQNPDLYRRLLESARRARVPPSFPDYTQPHLLCVNQRPRPAAEVFGT